MKMIAEQAKLCRAAAASLACCPSNVKNAALLAIAAALLAQEDAILAANAADVAAAEENGMIASMVDRLTLTPRRIADMAEGVRQVAALPDPIGEVVEGRTLPNGLEVRQVRVPLGTVGIIFESRPNVTVDAAALCLKSGNAALLRGGKEAIHSNLALGRLMEQALADHGLPPGGIQVVEDTARQSAGDMMAMTEYLDVLIPRGGHGLIRAVAQDAKVPVIRTGEGICHIFVDESSDLDMAVEILVNAKCSRPAVCNAVECVLVHRAVAADFWRKAMPALERYQVELRGCERTRAFVPQAVPAQETDWDSEYDDYILAAKVVDSAEEAIAFINAHGTRHSEAILTKDLLNARKFQQEVDAAAVYVNASTRFTDGFELGLGAEIGISTQKMHARGPMGLRALTSTKFLITGDGQIRG